MKEEAAAGVKIKKGRKWEVKGERVSRKKAGKESMRGGGYVVRERISGERHDRAMRWG